ncbi:hypothetical protein TSOC_004110 [Tetrabaena socialis]|uniref:Uncharacterized protein n=1 Tax=Tetrabaena socialis TaxID=47790 RepID=A0A2J8A9V2_9CHLO|nr:hypothetical protein TSOC_004110 [Tetrabaena socialis]|eukprot:PNH09289.1 hypothetical protein TSOC_004110 [Tetrabaena socialis]
MAQTFPSLASGPAACQASCSFREYATKEKDPAASAGRYRHRPTRHGSKLAMRDPERFARMRAVLGYPDDVSAPKVKSVTISLLQTIKYLMPEDKDLTGLVSYKVTSLNRELMPMLGRVTSGLQKPAAGATTGSIPSVAPKRQKQ